MLHQPRKTTGEYLELRERVQKIISLGFKVQSFSKLCGIPNTGLNEWLLGRRNLRHEYAEQVEKAIDNLKALINEF